MPYERVTVLSVAETKERDWDGWLASVPKNRRSRKKKACSWGMEPTILRPMITRSASSVRYPAVSAGT